MDNLNDKIKQINENIKETFTIKQSQVKELRENLIKIQKNICPICKKEMTDPVLDHEHKKRIKGSGKIRLVICRICNVYLGKIENGSRRFKIPLKELPIILKNMSEYLMLEKLNIIHYKEKKDDNKKTKQIKI